MARAVKFFRYKDKWFYKEVGKEVSDGIDTHALENILGVMGGPLVYVVRVEEVMPPKPLPGQPCESTPLPDILRVELRNGFIVRASKTDSLETPLPFGREVDEFFIRPIKD